MAEQRAAKWVVAKEPSLDEQRVEHLAAHWALQRVVTKATEGKKKKKKKRQEERATTKETKM